MSLVAPPPASAPAASPVYAPSMAGQNLAAAGAVSAVLGALVRASAYRAALAPILADVERVALLNLQVRGALEALAVRPGFAPAGLLRRACAEERTVKAFLEYVAFASPGFLSSVGEWPLGQKRG